jgi:hypothetical protein
MERTDGPIGTSKARCTANTDPASRTVTLSVTKHGQLAPTMVTVPYAFLYQVVAALINEDAKAEVAANKREEYERVTSPAVTLVKS